MHTLPARHFPLALSVSLLLSGGCQLPQKLPATAATKQQQIRINSYSLLHQLLDQQRNVDKLLVIKRESAELRQLIKSIATASAAGAERLENFAKQDVSISLDQFSLPPGEVATRDAIASTKKKELLTPFNPNFELDLLLTQSQALSYAWHLAKVAAANELRPEYARFLEAFSSDMKNLHGQVSLLMRSRLASAHEKGIRDASHSLQ